MLSAHGPRVITMVSAAAAVGKTTLILNLASALADAGNKVLLVDENVGMGNINEALSLRARYDLAHVLRGDRRLEDVLLDASRGVRVLPAARGCREFATSKEAGRVLKEIARLGGSADCVLFDACAGLASRFVSLPTPELDVAVVMSTAPASITQTYGLLKQLGGRWSGSTFRIIVTRAASADAAQTVYTNLARVAASRLGLTLEFVGSVPNDPCVKAAAELRRPVAEAFPESPAARAYRFVAAQISAAARHASAVEREGFLARMLTRAAPRLIPQGAAL